MKNARISGKFVTKHENVNVSKKQTRVNFRLPLRISYFVDEIADRNAEKIERKTLCKNQND